MKGLLRYVYALGLLVALGCGDSLFTSLPPEGETLDGTLDISPSLNASFARGDEQFERVFTALDGLGPTFNQPSCETCHPGDGRGTPGTNLTRFSIGGDLVPALGGPQLQDHAIPGSPVETLPAGAETSVRMGPPVFGMGLIEGIPAATLLALEDPDDLDGDGISGRANWVEPADFVPPGEIGAGPGLVVGRFGRKSNVSSLLEQVVNAYQQDMGITSDYQPFEPVNPQAGTVPIGDSVPDPEVPATEVNDVVMYVRLLSPPARGAVTAEVTRGGNLFEQIGCAACHTPSLRTGLSPIPALDQVDADLYSDLLLHDMGPGLADNRGDWLATGQEWRTAPLWGLRLAPDALGGQATYLHDGRATSLSEAIDFHGGESGASRSAYRALIEADRAAVVAFLESL
jgi:CxxC motif-containing protein (DUF1111 family)